MTRLVIHVGMPKTGTTTIQKTLAPNHDKLKSLGILYPDFGMNFDAHHFLVNLLVGDEDIDKRLGMNDDEATLEILSWNNDPNVDLIIISSENFASAKSFKDSFSIICDIFDVEIVWFFREQVAYANSMLNQMLKRRLFVPERTIEYCYNSISKILSYQSRLNFWIENLPKAKIKAVALEEGEDSWTHFVNIVDLRLNNISKLPSWDNVSLRPEALAYIDRFIMQRPVASHPERVRIMRCLNEYSHKNRSKGSFSLVPPAILSKLREEGLEQNRILSEKFFSGHEIFRTKKDRPYVDLTSIDESEILPVADEIIFWYGENFGMGRQE